MEEKVTKYHRTLTTYLNTLLSNSFIINQIVEPQPPENMMDIPGMADEMRRPMMLIVSAKRRCNNIEKINEEYVNEIRKEMMDLVLSLAEQDERIRIVTLEGHAQILIYLKMNFRIMILHIL